MRTNRTGLLDRIAYSVGASHPRYVVIGGILIVALLAFELFNFDTTRYALNSLLGNVMFLGVSWAAILAVAFCAIDFAGLARLFTPEKTAKEEPKEVWYLMGAWLLGATMNAVMTWWAVSLTLLQHPLGNEILGREELLRIVPIFVAVLVWLTRILFIGSLTVAGERYFDFAGDTQRSSKSKRRNYSNPKPKSAPRRSVPAGRTTPPPRPTMRTPKPAHSFSPINEEPQAFFDQRPSTAGYSASPQSNQPVRQQQPLTNSSRVRRRPPMPNNPLTSRPNMPVGMKASPKEQ